MTRDKEIITNHRRTSSWKIFSSCLDSKEPFISQTGFHSTSTITLLPFSKICLFRWSLIQISAGQTAACVCSLLMLWQANLGLLGSVKRLLLCFISMADVLVAGKHPYNATADFRYLSANDEPHFWTEILLYLAEKAILDQHEFLCWVKMLWCWS